MSELFSGRVTVTANDDLGVVSTFADVLLNVDRGKGEFLIAGRVLLGLGIGGGWGPLRVGGS